MKREFVKKMLQGVSVVLTAVMVIGVGIVTSSNEAQAAASDQTIAQTIEYKQVADAATYAAADKAPKATEVSDLSDGYLFAGWYKDGNGDVAYTEEEEVPNDAYAKFVPAYIMGVKTQVHYQVDNDGTVEYKTDVDATKENVYMRLVSAVDSDMYNEVGFKITAVRDGESEEKVWETEEAYRTTVYTYLKKKDAEGNVTDVQANQVFGTGAAYFFAYEVRKIPNVDNFDTAFYATPYWVTLDGTKVEGLAKYVHVEDYYEKLISVPVYLNSSTEAVAGCVSVEYDKEQMSFHGYEDGKLFDKGFAVANQEDGVVKCIANVSSLEDAEATGLFINLRFKRNEDATGPFNFYVTALESDFSTFDETLISTIDNAKIVAYDILY